MFAPGLANKYPQIKTYKGIGVNDPLASIRFSVSQIGLHALLHDNNSIAHYIEPELKKITYTRFLTEPITELRKSV